MDWSRPDLVDYGLDETTDLLRQTVRDFTAAHVIPIADRVDEESGFPRERPSLACAMTAIGGGMPFDLLPQTN